MPGTFSFYDLLGVSSIASTDEIKRAYKESITKYHPDVNTAGNAQALLMLFNEAWAVLGDAERRRDYDATMPASAKDFREYQRPRHDDADRRRANVAMETASSAGEAGERTPDGTFRDGTTESGSWSRPHVLALAGVAGLLIVVAAVLAVNTEPSTDEAAVAASAPPSDRLAALQPQTDEGLCRRTAIAGVSGSGARVLTTDGTSFMVPAQASGRVKAANWSTGDRVVVCASGSTASIDNLAQYEEVQAVVVGTVDASNLRCADRTIGNVGHDGATVVTSDGTSYAVVAQGRGRLKAAAWNTGDSVVVCTSGASASIDNSARYEKVQATLGRTVRAEPVRCSNHTIVRVEADGATISTLRGPSYAVDPRALGRTKTARWNTGDRIVVCTSGPAVSLEDPVRGEKVQAVRGSVSGGGR